MRVLVVHAHPLATSFLSAVHVRLVAALRAGGHAVDDLDLYAERFDPVLSPEQMRVYVDTEKNTREVEPYVARLRAAEALVLVFPVWFDGLPAILQGYFQRVFLPGVATVIDERGLFHRNLQNLKRLAAVCAYGESRTDVAQKLDPPRRFVRDNIGVLIDPDGRFDYHPLYNMNFSAPARRQAFMRSVERAFSAW
ncbi:putative NADPH-quinone reductase [Roseiarcus fermentans]|uniref:Putative NADPH-quinone reductase n=1 Tax=Roseiarcus fermentans TaxID=1473586 RepID=A0A366F0Z4_9HYPH|nr:NAD(P)H-dependent oxidoreductase [Roseiarcus fermentans]RBP07409.1 putative NADPH-quinone reductase [Roseiarcus fermentans]